MRRVLAQFAAFLMMSVLIGLLAVATGFTPDGIAYGQWPANHDHPTNWDDMALHPNR